jgi:VanZ family protein
MWLVVIGLATLTPESSPRLTAVPNACTRWCGDTLLVDFLLNILIFVPLGFATRRAGASAWRAVAIGSGLSLAIELLQLSAIAGRDASVLDWIANSLGTAIGVLLAGKSAILLRPAPSAARRLLLAGVVLWLLISIAGGWAIRPAATSALQWGQRAPELADYAPFEGELLSARVNEREIPSGPLSESDELRSLMRAGSVRVDATIRPGAPTRGLAPLVRVADSDRHEILLLAQYHQDIVFKVRLHTAVARMKTPSLALAKALSAGGEHAEVDESAAPATSPPVVITGVVEHGRMRLTVTEREGTKRTELTLSPNLMWSFFIPWDYWFGPNAPMLTALWIGGLLLPIGYWATVSASEPRGRPVVLVSLVAVAMSLLLVPLIFALPPTPGSHWLAALGGLLLGAAFGWRIRASDGAGRRLIDHDVGLQPS